MRLINYEKEIKETLEELQKAQKSLSSNKLRERCEILIWLKSGHLTTMKECVNLKGRSLSHGNRLWRLYKTEGLKGYLELKYLGQKSPLGSLEEREELKRRLETEGFSTINEARLWILKVYNISYTENGLGNYFRAQKIKLKTGRPHHPKQDEEKRAVYKKNM